MTQKRVFEVLVFEKLNARDRIRIGALAGQLVAQIPELQFNDALEILCQIGVIAVVCGGWNGE